MRLVARTGLALFLLCFGGLLVNGQVDRVSTQKEKSVAPKPKLEKTDVSFSTGRTEGKPGETIKILAKCVGVGPKGQLGFISGQRYVGDRPSITALELVAVFKKDTAAAHKLYADRWFVVEGLVVTNEANAHQAVLSGTVAPGEKVAPPPMRRNDLSMSKADVKLTAEEIHAQGQEKKLDVKKFDGKVVEITGVVSDFANLQESVAVELKGGKGDTVRCEMLDGEPWASLFPGQQVTLRGKIPEFLKSPQMWECAIVAKGPSPAVSMTAAELAKQYGKDPEGMNKKYDDKYLLVTGEVASVDTTPNNNGRLFLKGDGNTGVYLFYGFVTDLDPNLKPGTKLKALARFSTNSSEDKKNVRLDYPLLIFGSK